MHPVSDVLDVVAGALEPLDSGAVTVAARVRPKSGPSPDGGHDVHIVRRAPYCFHQLIKRD